MNKTSPEKTAKVIKTILEQPEASVREVAKVSDVTKSSVDRIKKRELGQLGQERTADIIERDLENLQLTQEIIKDILTQVKNGEREMKVGYIKDMVQAARDATHRTQLLRGAATERVENLNLNVDLTNKLKELEDAFYEELRK